jgi:hypothetical protein
LSTIEKNLMNATGQSLRDRGSTILHRKNVLANSIGYYGFPIQCGSPPKSTTYMVTKEV